MSKKNKKIEATSGKGKTRYGLKVRKNRSNPRFVSLRFKFAMVMLSSALAVIIAAIVLIPIAVTIVTGYYMEPKRIDARLDDYIQNFSDYVTDEQISSDDAAAVSRWSTFHRNVHLVVYGGDNAQLGVFDGEILEGDDLPELEDPILTDNISAGPAMGNTYMVRFADRVCTVSVMDYSGPAVYNGVHITGILIALLTFFVIILIYYHFQTKAILHLSYEVEQVSGGELSAPIYSKRNDEIGSLARDVDMMRTTILQKMEEQKAIREANSELITSMSHDIRTPLTTLLGYMELLQNDCEGMTREQKNYIRLCNEKTEQIKELSDKLFLYFWAYSMSEGDAEIEPCDLLLMMEQMMCEWFPTLENEGIQLQINEPLLSPDLRVAVDMKYLHRIFDNLFDNIRKYADHAYPAEVTLSLGENGKEVCICFKNAIKDNPNAVSGTRIGHKTCVNMAKSMGGHFETCSRENFFEARLSLPVFED